MNGRKNLIRKPIWLKKKKNLGKLHKMKSFLRKKEIFTVCEEANCPNQEECFQNKIATFMVMGNICTRNCLFCNVKKGRPKKLDFREIEKIILAIKKLNLKYVVITSPTRDDLFDKGVSFFYQCVRKIKQKFPLVKVEILTPDFSGEKNLIKKISFSGAEVIGHNLETVKRLYPKIKIGSSYENSLFFLKIVKEQNKKVFTKSGLILGMGEKEKEVFEALLDLKKVNCDFLTLGQYLSPSLRHYPVKEFISPKKFSWWEKEAYKIGFLKVKSFPYARSSYLAEQFLD